MADQDWICDPKFRQFWTNYTKGKTWYVKHQIAFWKSKSTATDCENHLIKCLYLQACKHGSEHSDFQLASDDNVSAIREERPPKCEPILEDIEMEVSDDMLDFLAQSMKHKRERKEIDGASSDQIYYISIDEMPVETRVVDETQHSSDAGPSNPIMRNMELSRNYHNLYGQSSTRIRAMETAVQLNFHRNCDRKQPKLWPNMPLHLN